MMRTFLQALGTSQVLISAASYLPGIRSKISLLKQKPNKKGYFSVVLGSGILGVGMALAGSCPGIETCYYTYLLRNIVLPNRSKCTR